MYAPGRGTDGEGKAKGMAEPPPIGTGNGWNEEELDAEELARAGIVGIVRLKFPYAQQEVEISLKAQALLDPF